MGVKKTPFSDVTVKIHTVAIPHDVYLALRQFVLGLEFEPTIPVVTGKLILEAIAARNKSAHPRKTKLPAQGQGVQGVTEI